jgi:hypothetical protein
MQSSLQYLRACCDTDTADICVAQLTNARPIMQAQEPLPEGVATRTVIEHVAATDAQWLADVLDEAVPGVDTVTLRPGEDSGALAQKLHAMLLAAGCVCTAATPSLLHFEYTGCTGEFRTLLQLCEVVPAEFKSQYLRHTILVTACSRCLNINSHHVCHRGSMG